MLVGTTLLAASAAFAPSGALRVADASTARHAVSTMQFKSMQSTDTAAAEQADRAKAMLDGRAVSYGGRMPTTLVVRNAKPPRDDDHVPAPPITGRVLWVGNLSFASRPAGVRDAFAAARRS